ncbi:MAG: hypothetical protein O7G84_01170 [Gammaproteobacteria bacterium]|nr:hypothetical protein [Gammaproteobacteria bacterium]
MTVGAFISAQDYRDYSGYGSSSTNEIAELRKALVAGNDVNDPGVAPGVGFPLRVESLEATMKNLTYEMDEIKLFKTIPKIPATNTVEEFNRLLAYGQGGSTRFNLGFMGEGDLPEEEDSTYERVTMLIKYLGVTGRVTHVANTIRAATGNVIALETMNKTMDLLKNNENALFFGDSTLIPEQFDGLQKLITDGAPDNVIDLRGAPLSENALNDMLLRIRQNFGTATDAYFATGAFADLAKQVYDRQRFAYSPAPGVLGATVTAFQGQHGRINLHDHVFIQEGPASPATGLGKTDKRPNVPSITVAPAAAANAASQFIAADDGTYIYQVVAGNRFGLSAPVDSAGVAVVAGEQVTFTIQDNGQSPTYYEIYRSTIGGAASTARLMVRVARTGATQVITDNNDDIPGTSIGFVLMQNQRSFSWAQLLPMTRIPLAAIDTSIRWAQVLYGGVKMYTPAKNIVVKNVGRAAGSL